MKKSIILSIILSAFLISGASATPVVATNQMHKIPDRVQYTAKFVCGYSDGVFDRPTAMGTYHTSINVRNNTETEVNVDKHFSVLYAEFTPLGREPNYANDQWQDFITLPPHTSTMDDCMRIWTITGYPIGTYMEGYVEFNAFAVTPGFVLPGLVVDGVYTVSSFNTATEAYSTSIDVERIPNDYVF